jgi:aspartate-semialdehyde dehydrogenase
VASSGSSPRVAILGATGAVGEVMRQVLHEKDFPLSELVCLASTRSAGTRVPFGDEELEVRAVEADAFDGIDIAIFSAGATRSREWAPIAIERGAVVVDNSSAFRMQDDVPLVVADVNPHALRDHRGLVANPNCSTMQLMPVLRAIRDEAGLEHVTVSTYQSVSGTGQKAITALQDETRRALAGETPQATVYAAPIAFNVVPLAGSFSGDDGYTDEELKLVNETRKILELPDLRISATCVRVPVVTSHSEAVWVETKEALGPDGLRAILRETPGIRVVDTPGVNEVPTALDAAGNDDVWVGRIRRDLGTPNGLAFWVVSDNLRKGAATNAVDIAHTLVRDDLLAGAGR